MKTKIGVSIKVNNKEYKFDFESDYLTEDLWNNHKYNHEILMGHIDAAIINYKNTHNITEETDSNSMRFTPHFHE